MDREKFKQQMRAELEVLMEEMADAVDNAPAGRIIRDSEEKVRDLFAEFRRKAFEEAMQSKVDAAEAAFPPSKQSDDGQAETQQGKATLRDSDDQRPDSRQADSLALPGRRLIDAHRHLIGRSGVDRQSRRA
jgi:hypothetical protein